MRSLAGGAEIAWLLASCQAEVGIVDDTVGMAIEGPVSSYLEDNQPCRDPIAFSLLDPFYGVVRE